MFLERLDDARYRAHGPSHDGCEVTIDYGKDGWTKSISFETTYLPRYVPEAHGVDMSLELRGVWRGEYNDSSGFHMLELSIEDEDHGSITDLLGNTMDLDGFKVASGKVTGGFLYRLPKEYARWGTSESADVCLELRAVSGELKGVLRSLGIVTPITFKKTL